MYKTAKFAPVWTTILKVRAILYTKPSLNMQTCACDPYDLYGDQALSSSLVLKMSNKEDFKDFEAMTEKQTLSPSKLVTFLSE